MALVLDSKQFAMYHARLAERFKPTLLRGVRAGAARAVSYLVDRTRTAPPANPSGIGEGGAVNTGNLVRRWRFVATPEGADLFNNAPYSPVVDGGRRPGKFPPRDALIPWIMRRILTTRSPERRSNRPRRGQRVQSEKTRSEADRRRLQADILRVARGEQYGPKRPPDARRRSRTASLEDQAARLYFPIARSIARRGLLARRILTGAEARAHILDLVKRETLEQVNREFSQR